MKALKFLLAAALACVAVPAAAQPRTFTLADQDRLVGVSSPQISPDGRTVAIVVSHVDVKRDKNVPELVLVDVASGQQRVLETGHDDVDEPLWSPDGSEITFIASSGTGDDAKPQVFVMPAAGGTATQVTHAKNGVESYALRPDGGAVAYLMQESPPDRPRGEDLFNAGDDPYSTQHPQLATYLWLQAMSGGAPEQLTSGRSSSWPDTPSWSADGRYVAFDDVPDGRFDSVFKSRIGIVDVATRRVTKADDRWDLSPVFAPSGDRLAYSAAVHGTFVLYSGAAIATVGGAPHWAAPNLDRNVQKVAWLPNGRGLLVAADDRVSSALWRVSPSGVARRVALGTLDAASFSVGRDGGIAVVASSSTRPSELYYIAPGANAPRRLTNFNGAIAALDLAPSRAFTWHNDGYLEDGVLTYPVGYQRGRRYPLVLDIHGGPIDEASTMGFDSLVQLLAARGFVVLQPNYRGSDNLGFRYADAIIGRNPIAGPGRDDVAGVRALEAAGVADPARIGVSGWSAGGWSTSWLITQYNIFKAAVSGASIEDQIMQYTMSQGPAFIPEMYGGLTPWQPGGLDAYRDSSPITYVRNVHAATLILSDTTDPRVPTPEAYLFYKALRDLGRNVRLTLIPAYGHHPSDPVHNREINRVWVDWMVKYLRP